MQLNGADNSSTHWFLAFNEAGQVDNGSGFVDWVDGDYATYKIAATRIGTTSTYRFNPRAGTSYCQILTGATGTLATYGDDLWDEASIPAIAGDAMGLTDSAETTLVAELSDSLLAPSPNAGITGALTNPTPSQIFNPKVWYRAKLCTGTVGTTRPTTLVDQSGNGNDAVGGSMLLTQVNGKNALLGGNDGQQYTSINPVFTNGSAVTVFCVTKMANGQGFRVSWASSGGHLYQQRQVETQAGFNGEFNQLSFETNGITRSGDFGFGNFNNLTTLWTHPDDYLGVSVFRYDGTTVQTGFNGAFRGVLGAGTLNVAGEGVVVGTLNGGGYNDPGIFCELIVHDGSSLSHAQANVIMAYLVQEWSIPIRKVVVCDGNSITYGTATSNPTVLNAFPAQLQWLFDRASAPLCLNFGKPGKDTTFLTQNFETAISWNVNSLSDPTLVCSEGINDRASGSDLATMEANTKAYLAQARSLGFRRIYGWPILPESDAATSATRGGTTAWNSDRVAYNAYLRTLVPSLLDYFVPMDENQQFGSLQSQGNDSRYLEPDGVHITQLAHAILAGELRGLIQPSTQIGSQVTSALNAQGLTAGRAANLDNLDGSISSIASTLSGVATAVWSVGTRTLTAISDSSGVTTLLSRIGTPSVTIAADIATRAAPGAQMDLVNAPNSAAVTAIKSGLATSTSITNLQTTANNIYSTVTGIVSAVWAAGSRTLTTIADSSGISTLLGRIPGTVQPQTGDSFARLGTPAHGSIASDIASISGAVGAHQLTINVADSSSGNPVVGASVTVSASSPATTDTSGNALVGLDTGTYTVTVTAAGYLNSLPGTQVVDGAGHWVSTGSSTLNLTIVAIAVPSPAPAGQVYASGYVANLLAEPTAQVTYRSVTPPAAGVIGSGKWLVAPIDQSSGLVQVLVNKNCEYEFRYGRGDTQPLLVKEVDCQIPGLLSAQTPNAPM